MSIAELLTWKYLHKLKLDLRNTTLDSLVFERDLLGRELVGQFSDIIRQLKIMLNHQFIEESTSDAETEAMWDARAYIRDILP